MAVSLKWLYLKKEVWGGTYFMASLVCVHLSSRSDIYLYNLTNIELITTLGEVINNDKGSVGWLICLHNLCMGWSIRVTLFFFNRSPHLTFLNTYFQINMPQFVTCCDEKCHFTWMQIWQSSIIYCNYLLLLKMAFMEHIMHILKYTLYNNRECTHNGRDFYRSSIRSWNHEETDNNNPYDAPRTHKLCECWG